jgi:TatD DNase family protein
VIDSHTHLTSCDSPVEELVAEAIEAGVERIVTIGCGRASSERAVELTHEFPEVYAAIGVHPHDADDWRSADEKWIGGLSEEPKVVAIGECGLDYYRDIATREGQMKAFVSQIGIAREVGLPVVVHTRDAADDTLAVLAHEAEAHPVILHCFSMSGRVDEVVERGYLTSFAGQVTYPTATDLQEAARRIPPELLLVETDAPYLSPVPRRGRPNRPANVAHTLRFLAELRGEDADELDAVTSANSARVFGW